MRRITLFSTVIVVVATLGASADLATISVDITNKTVDPVNPTINIAANDSVLLSVISDGKPLDAPVTVTTRIAGPRALMKRGDAFVYTDFPMETGTKSPLLVFQRCDRQARTEYRIDTTRPDESRITNPTPEFEEPRCPFYTIDDSQTLWTVVIDQGTILVRVAATFPASGDQPKRVEEHAFALQVVDRPYALHWSAGFTFNTVRDEEYRLDPDSSDDTKLKLIRNGSGSVPYQLGAFAHYTKLSKRRDSTRSLSASFGIGTKVPVNELTAMLGATYSLRTLPVVNAGHLTVGMAYAPHKTLISDYRGLGTVPAGTSSASLTASRYGFGVFVAVTFSFLGGEEQFRGVYSGKGSTKDDK